ncbi:hypothetical protein KGM_210194 [Danaus plexippus plexippus]|uniref:Uncharacterized protein n=1 Tax=Danaus plexippus plexippus TaxID=278856 RepID=A0A212F852_DANPL|nr:hypothetical protein KGM_210194 [Danaus plexippus plexippus]
MSQPLLYPPQMMQSAFHHPGDRVLHQMQLEWLARTGMFYHRIPELGESLIELLLDCVNNHFWSMEHSSKTHRDIAHKASGVMRMLGDLLSQYRKCFLENTNLIHYRSTYLRLVPCGEMLLSWSKKSALPPSSLTAAMQVAQIDPRH